MIGDTNQKVSLIASFFGSVLWALANYYAIAIAPAISPDKSIKNKAIVEGCFAVISGVIGGWYAAPAICEWYKITDIQLVSLIGLLTGLVFWKLIPGLTLSLVAWIQNKVGKKA